MTVPGESKSLDRHVLNGTLTPRLRRTATDRVVNAAIQAAAGRSRQTTKPPPQLTAHGLDLTAPTQEFVKNKIPWHRCRRMNRVLDESDGGNPDISTRYSHRLWWQASTATQPWFKAGTSHMPDMVTMEQIKQRMFMRKSARLRPILPVKEPRSITKNRPRLQLPARLPARQVRLIPPRLGLQPPGVPASENRDSGEITEQDPQPRLKNRNYPVNILTASHHLHRQNKECNWTDDPQKQKTSAHLTQPTQWVRVAGRQYARTQRHPDSAATIASTPDGDEH